MKALVTGANGMLGQDLCPILEDNGYEVIETDIESLDITKDCTRFVLETQPDLVIHCAAYTNVDKAEEDLETARLINVVGTENMARACKKANAVMVYISTDYVFDGHKSEPYNVNDIPNPLNNYGLTKLQGEESVKKYCEQYYIVRTSWLYGHHGRNFVETMLSLSNNPEIKVVDDQFGCPTWTVEFAKGIVKLLDKPFGTYHICGSGFTSWYGFAKEIFELEGLEVNLKPCLTDEFPRPAKRPQFSAMYNDNMTRSWKSALKDYLALREVTV